jgi:hypothetical protein
MMKRNIHVQTNFPDFLSNSVNESNKLCSDSFIALGQLGTMQGTFPLQMPNHIQAPLQRKLFTQVSPLLVRELDLNNDVGGAHHLV